MLDVRKSRQTIGGSSRLTVCALHSHECCTGYVCSRPWWR